MFDIIEGILVKKDGSSLTRNDFESEFNLYMIQRWISTHSDISLDILNQTVNILYGTLDKEQHYKLMEKILPSCKTRRRYIKSAKGKTKTKKDEIDLSDYFEESSSKIDESLRMVLGEKNE